MSRRRLMFPFLLLLFSTLALTLGAPESRAQDDSLPPPRVIDVWPLPGVELSPDQPLTITFDQPMDQASVEAAFDLTPALSGAFSWVDTRTMRFLPEAEWPRNTAFDAVIGEAAAASSGQSLEAAYQFGVQTVGSLLVASVVPEPAAQFVEANSRIVVTFDRPVVPLVSTGDMSGLPTPITIEPAVDGTGEWINTSMFAFTPTTALEGGTTYTVTVPSGLTGSDGALLEQTYQWSFHTLPPQITEVRPAIHTTDVLLEQPVEISFSQPMDRTSTEQAVSVTKDGAAIPGTFSWNTDSTKLTFQPAASFEMESTYVVNIAPTARSASGQAALDGGVTSPFTTVPYPRVQEAFPSNGRTDVDPFYANVSIAFNAPINWNTLEGRIVISPEPESWFPETYEWDKQNLYLRFNPMASTTYTITILEGVEDVYGNAIPTDYTFSFTTSAVEPDAYPVINGNFMITGAYREDTRFAMLTSGAGSYDVSLYEMDTDSLDEAYAWAFDDYYYPPEGVQTYAFGEILPPWATPDRLIRSWTQPFNTGNETRQPQEVLLASESGGQLPMGLYWVTVDTETQTSFLGASKFQFVLAVANATVTVKRGPEETFVWVTNMIDGTPAASTDVTLFHGGEVVASGQTDADGVYRAPVLLPQDENPVYVVAESENSYGAWYSNRVDELPTERGYLYTDRPVYRPGETVYYRGVLRERHDMDYDVPDTQTIHVTVKQAWQDTVYLEADVPLTEFGSFSGEFTIPTDTTLGEIAIIADYGDGMFYQYGSLFPIWDSDDTSRVVFNVAEFRVPEYEVELTAQQESVIQGESLNLLAEANYYAGGGVSDAPLIYTVYGSSVSFNYTGPGSYSFYDATQQSFYYQDLDRGEAATNEQGQLLIGIENTTASVPLTMEIMAEVSIMDESGQSIAGRTSVIAHPSNVYVGMGADSAIGNQGDPIEVEIITVTPESAPVGGKTVELEIVEQAWMRRPIEGQFGRYRWGMEETLIATDRVQTDANGTAHYTFVPPSSGSYQIHAVTRDEQERVNGSTLNFWIQGEEMVFWGGEQNNVQLVADKQEYVPGDTARILVPIPFTGRSTVLLSAERAGVMTYDVIEVEGTTLVYDLPITDAFVPTVYVQATVVHGIDEEIPYPDYRTGVIELNIDPAAQRLTIEAEPSSELNAPRSTVSFDLTATDAEGNPVQAEIGVALTDEAVLSLMPPNSTTLEEMFYGKQQNYVVTGTSLYSLLDRLTDAMFPGGRGGGGGGGGENILIRENFVYTPLWAPSVITDENGQATVSVELPDNLTTWRLDARAVTLNTDVGQTTTQIVSTLPLIVRPVAPRFFVVGDRVQLAAIINNNTDEEQSVVATLQSSGVQLQSEESQTVTIAPNSRARVEWMVVAEDVEGVDLTFQAVGNEGYTDAVKPALRTGPNDTIPVYAYTAPDIAGTGGMLREGGAATEIIALPTRFDTVEGELRVNVDPSLASTALDTFDYLRTYPCDCIDQTVNKFLPNIITYQALSSLGVSNPELEANLNASLTESLETLVRNQNPDGSWGWFPGMIEGDPMITAYAALGLIEARNAGFGIDLDIIDSALNFVHSHFVRPDVSTPSWQLNRQAFFLYVLSRDGQLSRADLQALFDRRLDMSLAGRAYLLMAADQAFPGDPTFTAPLVSDLTNAAVITATGAHWEELVNDWYNWGSDTRTTALALSALARTEPENPLLPNAVRWLMTARQSDHWETTQETAWAVMALTDWMKITGELNPNYDYTARVNEETLAQANVTSENVDEAETLRIDVATLLTEQANRLQIARSEGPGALYYTAFLDLRLPASEVDALSRGVTVTREYFLNGDPNQAVTSAQVGEVVTVRLTLTLPQDMHYFTLEDPLPGGLESIDTSLLTSSVTAQDPTLRMPLESDPFWFWGWWWFDRTELRDQQTTLYADFLPRGTYVYTYQTRASVPGDFQVMPAQGYAFYQPEVFGRTDGATFTVSAAPEAE